jgi:hypothetical protein
MEFTTGPSMYGPYDVVPAADRIFEAKISDVFHFGFTLEAYIDNKPLRGLLFSYKPGFAHAAHNYVSRLAFQQCKFCFKTTNRRVSAVSLVAGKFDVKK